MLPKFTYFLEYCYRFWDITMLADDENLGECNGSTMAGIASNARKACRSREKT
jgi:hypothetical protein